jgi:hypothetical protein
MPVEIEQIDKIRNRGGTGVGLACEQPLFCIENKLARLYTMSFAKQIL